MREEMEQEGGFLVIEGRVVVSRGMGNVELVAPW